MDIEQRDALIDIFENILNEMGASFERDFQEVGLKGATKRLELRVMQHQKEQGTWIDAPDVERPAHMLWAAAELVLGALINAGVWHE